MYTRLIYLLAVLLISASLLAQGRGPGVTVDWRRVEQRVAWFGTWDRAKAAAKRTNRPILVVSAAPHCNKVPGVW
ncbi:MAG: hypothetical protein CMJ85_03395 [Planctomycetes bacterium]|nr:hypothetical protein [Planctomycetota bacterium]